MTSRHVSLRAILILSTSVAAPAAAGAQAQGAVPVSPKLPPGITFSAGVGAATAAPSGFSINSGERSPYVSASVEVALNRFILAQGELVTWTQGSSGTYPGRVINGFQKVGYTGDTNFSNRRREAAVMGNFLGRVGASRYFGTLGIGFGISRSWHNDTTDIVGCVPVSKIDCTQTHYDRRGSSQTIAAQFLAGLDVMLTPKLTAFMNLRSLSSRDTQAIATAGLRWTAMRPPVSPGWPSAPNPSAAASAIGKGVHVEAYDHSRRNGTLVSLTGTHVTIRSLTGDATIPLSDVRGIRRQTHAILKGSLAGFGGGFVTGLLLCAANDCDGDDASTLGVSVMFGCLGLGGGAAIGAVYNLTTADSRIVYVGKPRATVALTPIVAKGRLGAGGRITW
jgi:hypothetical protein